MQPNHYFQIEVFGGGSKNVLFLDFSRLEGSLWTCKSVRLLPFCHTAGRRLLKAPTKKYEKIRAYQEKND